MFKEIPGGTIEEIPNHNGFVFKCWVPPFGYGVDVSTGKLEPTDVIKISEVKSEQKWERPTLPKDWNKRRREEERKREALYKAHVAKGGDPDEPPEYYDPYLMEFENREWKRRLRGVWVMINGKKTYLTGLHYMYISWWKYQGKYMDYRDPDRKFFYVWRYCEEDPDSLGLIEFTKRKDGKTARAGLILYEPISRTPNVHGGIQSKTDVDGEEVFKKAVVTPWRYLPDFFRPVYDEALGDSPKRELRLFATSKRGKGSHKMGQQNQMALDSWIDFAASVAEAYDGPELFRYVSDECGKLKKVSILDRHNVVMFCSEVNGKYIGKQYYCTTVEEMESGGAEFKELVENSDASKKDKVTNRTISGLYVYFRPYYQTLNFDEYGMPDEIRNKKEHAARCAALQSSGKSLSSFIRKNPNTVEDAFRVDGDKCIYNSDKLNQQRDILSWNKNFVERGNFAWKDGKRDTVVIWEPSKNGRWEMCKGFQINAGGEKDKGVEIQNFGVEKIGGTMRPKFNWRFGSGLDPYKSNDVEDNKKASQAASLVKQKANIFNQEDPLTGAYICKYRHRGETVTMLGEDMIMQCVYFGTSILIENNVGTALFDYFKIRGYGAFLMYLPGYKEPGIPSTEENKQTAFYLMEAQVENNSNKIFFTDLIDDLLNMNLKKTRKYDLGMCGLWTEVACENPAFRASTPLDTRITVKDIFKPFKKKAG